MWKHVRTARYAPACISNIYNHVFVYLQDLWHQETTVRRAWVRSACLVRGQSFVSTVKCHRWCAHMTVFACIGFGSIYANAFVHKCTLCLDTLPRATPIWSGHFICHPNRLCDWLTPNWFKCIQQYSFSNAPVTWSAEINDGPVFCRAILVQIRWRQCSQFVAANIVWFMWWRVYLLCREICVEVENVFSWTWTDRGFLFILCEQFVSREINLSWKWTNVSMSCKLVWEMWF